MGWLKRFMGFEAPRPADLPLGLGRGRTLAISPALKPLLEGRSELVVLGNQTICASGDINLGQSVHFRRFYLDDEDYWLQVVMNGPSAKDVGDIILFGYHSVVPIANEAELKRLVGPGSKVGLPFYHHDGCGFAREWGSEPGQTELIPFSEWVVTPEDSYRIQHLALLYARDIGLPGRREFLLLSVEEDARGNLSLTTSVGATLLPTDFHVT
ncbi:DUF2491 family protein [Pseudomonas entomophila]|uniref:DUF2491 family protein n=1 Tax=Pseudomonas entomophila TaxID=312306 RepID=UPI0023D8227B|nr:DUF2491 family protein [Pseudomonas entomophila]MDF0733623.1 DUF2491 family protein [Pseudomonas entomophila]